MVTETNETITQMFDSMTTASKACVDAGQRFQDSWFTKVGQGQKGSNGSFSSMFDLSDKMARAWFPFFNNATTLVTECATACIDANTKAVKTSVEKGMGACDGSCTCEPKELWNSAFGAAQANFDAVNKAGRRAMENWTGFCKTACNESCSTKPSGKDSKDHK